MFIFANKLRFIKKDEEVTIFLIAGFVHCKCPSAVYDRHLTIMKYCWRPTVETSVIQLFNETPRHRDNFLKLVRSGAYNGVLFHRVVKDFMIQTGDLGSKNAKPGQALGDTPETYSLPAEIVYPKFVTTVVVAVAAAREGDDVNPKRESSAHNSILYGV